MQTPTSCVFVRRAILAYPLFPLLVLTVFNNAGINLVWVCTASSDIRKLLFHSHCFPLSLTMQKSSSFKVCTASNGSVSSICTVFTVLWQCRYQPLAGVYDEQWYKQASLPSPRFSPSSDNAKINLLQVCTTSGAVDKHAQPICAVP